MVRVVVDEAWNRDGARVLASVTFSSSCAVLGIFSRAPKSSPRNPGLERREWGREGGGEALREPCTEAKFGTRLVSNVARLGTGRLRESLRPKYEGIPDRGECSSGSLPWNHAKIVPLCSLGTRKCRHFFLSLERGNSFSHEAKNRPPLFSPEFDLQPVEIGRRKKESWAVRVETMDFHIARLVVDKAERDGDENYRGCEIDVKNIFLWFFSLNDSFFVQYQQ